MDFEFDDSFDQQLADIPIPDAPTTTEHVKDNTIPLSPPSSSIADPKDSSTAVPSTSAQPPPEPRRINKNNCILVHPKQRGNPILKSITNIPWEFDEILPDYVVGAKSCVLFLSLKYHNLNPDYIHTRIKQLGKNFEMRVLLAQVDLKEPQSALKNITRVCFLTNFTLMLAWSPEEAGKILETYKMLENKPPDLIRERPEQHPHQKLVTALTNIKPVNKTDAMILLQNYGSLASVINSTEERLNMCPGLGPRKAKKLHKLFNEPFLS